MDLINIINSCTIASLVCLCICMLLLLKNFDRLEKVKEKMAKNRFEKNEDELWTVRNNISNIEKFKSLFLVLSTMFIPLSSVILVSILLKISTFMTYLILGVAVIFEIIYFTTGGINDVLGKYKK